MGPTSTGDSEFPWFPLVTLVEYHIFHISSTESCLGLIHPQIQQLETQQHNKTECNTKQHNGMQHNTAQCNKTQQNATQHNEMQQCHGMQHNTM